MAKPRRDPNAGGLVHDWLNPRLLGDTAVRVTGSCVADVEGGRVTFPAGVHFVSKGVAAAMTGSGVSPGRAALAPGAERD